MFNSQLWHMYMYMYMYHIASKLAGIKNWLQNMIRLSKLSLLETMGQLPCIADISGSQIHH